jgi:hypothetical protein
MTRSTARATIVATHRLGSMLLSELFDAAAKRLFGRRVQRRPAP